MGTRACARWPHWELGLFLFFSIFVWIVTIKTERPHANAANAGVHGALTGAGNWAVDGAITPATVWTWLSRDLIPTLYGDPLRVGNASNWVTTPAGHFLVGPLGLLYGGTVRLRQVRALAPSRDACELPASELAALDDAVVARLCPSETALRSDFDGTAYGTGTDRTPATWGVDQWYSGDGFATDLPLGSWSIDDALSALNNLSRKDWLDTQTRAVFVDLVFYKGGLGSVSVATTLFEFPPTGGSTGRVMCSTVKLFRYAHWHEIVLAVCELVFLLLLLGYCAVLAVTCREVARRWRTSGARGLARDDHSRGWWTLAVVCVWGAFVLARFSQFGLAARLPLLGAYPPAFVEAHPLVQAGAAEDILAAGGALLVWLRWAALVWPLGGTRSLAGVMVIGAFLLGWANCAYLLFYAVDADYTTVLSSAVALVRLLLGDVHYDALAEANRVLGPVLLVCFVGSAWVLGVIFVVRAVRELLLDTPRETLERAVEAHEARVALLGEFIAVEAPRRWFGWEVPSMDIAASLEPLAEKEAWVAVSPAPKELDTEAAAPPPPESPLVLSPQRRSVVFHESDESSSIDEISDNEPPPAPPPVVKVPPPPPPPPEAVVRGLLATVTASDKTTPNKADALKQLMSTIRFAMMSKRLGESSVDPHGGDSEASMHLGLREEISRGSTVEQLSQLITTAGPEGGAEAENVLAALIDSPAAAARVVAANAVVHGIALCKAQRQGMHSDKVALATARLLRAVAAAGPELHPHLVDAGAVRLLHEWMTLDGDETRDLRSLTTETLRFLSANEGTHAALLAEDIPGATHPHAPKGGHVTRASDALPTPTESAMILGNLLGRDEESPYITPALVDDILAAMRASLRGEPYRTRLFSLASLTVCLDNLSTSESNKLLLVREGCIPVLTMLIGAPHIDAESERRVASVLRNLSFRAENKALLRADPVLLRQFQRLSVDAQTEEASAAAQGTLWLLRQGSEDDNNPLLAVPSPAGGKAKRRAGAVTESTPAKDESPKEKASSLWGKVRSRITGEPDPSPVKPATPTVTETATPEVPAAPAAEVTPVEAAPAAPAIVGDYVMLSYSWSSQALILRIRDALRAAGVQVWIDVEQMQGSTLAAMASAVEGAKVVLICFSRAYRESANCRLEGEYAFQKRKKIIPLLVESGYMADGWLGALLGTKLWYDFSGQGPIDTPMSGMLKELSQALSTPVIVEAPKSGVITPVPSNDDDDDDDAAGANNNTLSPDATPSRRRKRVADEPCQSCETMKTAISVAQDAVHTLSNRVHEVEGQLHEARRHIDDLNRTAAEEEREHREALHVLDKEKAVYASGRDALQAALQATEVLRAQLSTATQRERVAADEALFYRAQHNIDFHLYQAAMLIVDTMLGTNRTREEEDAAPPSDAVLAAASSQSLEASGFNRKKSNPAFLANAVREYIERRDWENSQDGEEGGATSPANTSPTNTLGASVGPGGARRVTPTGAKPPPAPRMVKAPAESRDRGDVVATTGHAQGHVAFANGTAPAPVPRPNPVSPGSPTKPPGWTGVDSPPTVAAPAPAALNSDEVTPAGSPMQASAVVPRAATQSPPPEQATPRSEGSHGTTRVRTPLEVSEYTDESADA